MTDDLRKALVAADEALRTASTWLALTALRDGLAAVLALLSDEGDKPEGEGS